MKIGSDNGGKQALLWQRLIGNNEEFSMENRAFNFVSIISFFLLTVCIAFNFYIKLYSMMWITLVLAVLLALGYYVSRYKKRYKISLVVYIVVSYIAVFFNYFKNGGINGPTIILSYVSFIFLITLGSPKQYFFWKVLHVFLVATLLTVEYLFPDTVPNTYLTRSDRFLDVGVSVAVSITFIYALMSYVRKYYDERRQIADDRARAIEIQNKQILLQNKQLELVNEEKNKIFSIVSHDLKGPLDSIRGYLVLLSGNLLDENEKAAINEDLQEQTKYTTDLLMNLMSWAKAQMHGVTVNLTPLNLQSLVDDAVGHIKSVAARKGIKLTYSIPKSVEVVSDKDMLHIVLRNLINNAIKFTEPGGEVKIQVTAENNEAVIAVQDTGIGIPPEKQKEIFTMKTRSTYGTRKEKGIGLGLMMCKEFMDYQNGKIWFESTQGTGTTFFISLPLTKLK